MFQAKTCLITLIRQNYSQRLLSPLLLLSRQQQTNATTAIEQQKPETTAEWERAKPFEEIPTDSTFNVMRKFLPGGKYYNCDPEQLMDALQKDYGGIFTLPNVIGMPKFVMTNNPDDFELIFRNEGVWPDRPGSETLAYFRQKHRPHLYEGSAAGLLGTQGEEWGKFRSIVNPVLMQPKNVRLYMNKMAQVNLEFVERIKEIRDPTTLEVPETFEEEINRWTLESVSVVALDKQLGLLKKNRHNPEVKKLFTYLTEFLKLTFELEIQPSLWKYIATPKFNRLMIVLENIQELSRTYVDEAIQRLEEERRRGIERPSNEQSVLEKLLKIDKNVAVVMATDLLMAGVDTTTTTFTGVMLCLAKYPEKQEKLRQEVLRLLPQKDSNFDESTIKNASYLRACIKESQRIYPLAIGNARVLHNNAVLSGYRIPKGTPVSMVTKSVIHNDKYFPRATEYIPERWLRSTAKDNECPESLKTGNPFVFLPFGFGPRMCIGKRIVDMELEMGVARIIRNFHVEFNHPTENAFKSLLINVPNIPLRFKFTDVE